MRAEIDDLRRLFQNSEAPAPRRPAVAAPGPARGAAQANRAAAAKRVAPAKRRAAKRTHVAAKSTAPEPAESKQTIAEPAKDKTRPAHGKKRRDARRAPARIREALNTPKAGRPQKIEARPASFGDAIAAMRRELSGKSGKKK